MDARSPGLAPDSSAETRSSASLGGLGWRGERGEPSLGWMAGWAEKGSAHTVFALNMDCPEPRLIPERMVLTQACLKDIGAI